MLEISRKGIAGKESSVAKVGYIVTNGMYIQILLFS
jgi:hypothetical protein